MFDTKTHLDEDWERTAEQVFWEEGSVTIPAGLDEMTPGPELAAHLAQLDLSRLSGHDQVVVLRAQQRMASHYSAGVYRSMALIAESLEEMWEGDMEAAFEAAALEIRAALRLTRRAADSELGLAHDLQWRLPEVGAALAGGEIDVRRAKVLCNGTGHLSVGSAREVVDEIIGDAPRLTTGQLGARVRKLCVEVDPEEAGSRYCQAVDDRRVVTEANDSGTGNLSILDAPPHLLAEAFDHINNIARGLKTGDESRTIDQIRSDVAVDLLRGRVDAKCNGRGTVDIHVDLETLAGLEDKTGDLAGFGPVVADIARQVVSEQEDSQWRFTVTDPDSGLPVHVGTTRRRPTAALRREVEAHNLTCVFPGCRMPAMDCDIDHTIPRVEHGPTTFENLAPVCRHDHTGRHAYGWSYRPLGNGDYVWVSPLGHTYTTSGRAPPPKQ